MRWDMFDEDFGFFEEMERMHQEMDNIFGRMLGSKNMLPYKGKNKGLMRKDGGPLVRSPVCHVQETENSVIAAVEIPGVDKKDIDLRVHDDSMEIRVESKHEKKSEIGDSTHYASYKSNFYRHIGFPAEVYGEKAKAVYNNGVVRIEIPKKKDSSKRGTKIDIE